MAVRRRIFCGESCGAGIRTGVFPGGLRRSAVERKSRGGFCAHGGGRFGSTLVGLRGIGESPRPERADGDSRAVGQRVAEVRVPADDALRPARRARQIGGGQSPRVEECAEQRRRAGSGAAMLTASRMPSAARHAGRSPPSARRKIFRTRDRSFCFILSSRSRGRIGNARCGAFLFLLKEGYSFHGIGMTLDRACLFLLTVEKRVHALPTEVRTACRSIYNGEILTPPRRG